MKFLKFATSLCLLVFLLFAFSSCKKEHAAADTSVKKEQLLGKWDMILQGTTVQTMSADLRGSGAMALDLTNPADGIDDMIFLWDTETNKFNAHLDLDSVVNAIELHGNIDPVTLGISGTFKLNDPQSPQIGIFTMDKKK